MTLYVVFICESKVFQAPFRLFKYKLNYFRNVKFLPNIFPLPSPPLGKNKPTKKYVNFFVLALVAQILIENAITSVQICIIVIY